MPPKTFTCVICNQEVSKRKSLAFSDGRACRDHEEVKEMVRMAEEQAKMEKIDRDINEKMAVIMLTEQIRVFHTVKGMPIWLLLERAERMLRNSDMDLKVLDQIKEALKERGEKISRDEMEQAMMSWMLLQSEATKNREDSPEQT